MDAMTNATTNATTNAATDPATDPLANGTADCTRGIAPEPRTPEPRMPEPRSPEPRTPQPRTPDPRAYDWRAGPGPGGGAGRVPRRPQPRPVLSELRLSAFGPHRAAAFGFGPVTLIAGPSGSGKSRLVAACTALAGLGAGGTLAEVFPEPAACVPDGSVPDAERRRGFRIGCTVDGPAGPVRLDLAVQAEPSLRIVGERLSAGGRPLLTTALREPRLPVVEAAWLTEGTHGVTRAPLPDDRLGTALLPLRVAGRTEGQRRVLAAAEQVVVALRSVYGCDPRPEAMREPVPLGAGRLAGNCADLADVLRRTRRECGTRYALLLNAAWAGCAGGPVREVAARALAGGRVVAELVRESGPATPLARLGDGELRFLAFALVLLTGPGVLAVDPAAELPSARQALTVLADGFDRCLDRRQRTELVRLAVTAAERGHLRLVATVGEDAMGARGLPGVSVVDLVP
ncbi:ATP-binding protein [Streptomyces sp. NPDC089799]|uniref:ATP-binding protein n=1 Tax=Streptomyces sp. NPDC089799 TaxID=3155066 RepID=UPI00341521AC